MDLQWCDQLYHPIYFVLITCSDLLLQKKIYVKKDEEENRNSY